jgi:hypothetical protein
MIDKNKTLEFAKYFAANWEFEDSTTKGDVYISKTGNIRRLLVDEIFHEWDQEYSFKDKLKHIIIPRLQDLEKVMSCQILKTKIKWVKQSNLFKKNQKKKVQLN